MAFTIQQHNSGSTQERAHAVVIGGSIAGLFAARVLSDHFNLVASSTGTVSPISLFHVKASLRRITSTLCWHEDSGYSSNFYRGWGGN
jgi:hypothetical protein